MTQPSCINKALLAAHIGARHKCTTMVETGTYIGASSYLFSGVFNSVHTIEADPFLHSASSTLFSTLGSRNIHSHGGDSGAVLPVLARNLTEKTIFFLDGHYSGGITSKQYGFCPLMAELTGIFSSNLDSVIIIDDARDMGNPQYPSLREIMSIIPEGRSAFIEYDQIIIA